MEYHYAISLKVIERMISTKEYKKKTQVREHLSFLENLANHINDKIKEQKEYNIICWEEEYDLNRVKQLFSKLSDELKIMDSIITDKPNMPKDLF